MKLLLQTIGFGLAFVAIYAVGAVRYPLDPALTRTQSYERHYRLVATFPFVASYLLYTPKAYDPARSYPLVLSLHGASQRSYEAYHLASNAMQQRHECFVLLPMSPPYRGWANQDGTIGTLDFAMGVLADVVEQYSIDENRIYLTGHSMGGIGTFAALAHYPGRFAGAVAVNGYWLPEQAPRLKSARLWVFHGEMDQLFPVDQTRAFVEAIEASGGAPKFTLMEGIGHQSAPAYKRPELWEWLFEQRLGS